MLEENQPKKKGSKKPDTVLGKRRGPSKPKSAGPAGDAPPVVRKKRGKGKLGGEIGDIVNYEEADMLRQGPNV